jgi:hypothetical protein
LRQNSDAREIDRLQTVEMDGTYENSRDAFKRANDWVYPQIELESMLRLR